MTKSGVKGPMLVTANSQGISWKWTDMSARGRFLLPTDFDDVKVRLQNLEGKFLVTDPSGWTFSEDYTKAFVFDYVGDRIEEYLESIARMRGVILKATPVDPKEFLETCDQCQRVIAPSRTFFDGRRFLCPRCWTRVQARHSRPQPRR